MHPGLDALLKAVEVKADATGDFADTFIAHEWLNCVALSSSEYAEYRLGVEDLTFWIELVTEDRWLSESIESDLVDNGDDIEELLADEAKAAGYKGAKLGVKHYRSASKMYTFRTPIPITVHPDGDVSPTPENIETVFLVLMSYQQVFGELGDMGAKAKES